MEYDFDGDRGRGFGGAPRAVPFPRWRKLSDMSLEEMEQERASLAKDLGFPPNSMLFLALLEIFGRINQERGRIPGHIGNQLILLRALRAACADLIG